MNCACARVCVCLEETISIEHDEMKTCGEVEVQLGQYIEEAGQLHVSAALTPPPTVWAPEHTNLCCQESNPARQAPSYTD
jgi:hypothetical protein